MRLTDWRGNEYGVGDTILYARMSGRSCEISEATVVDIWRTYSDKGRYNRLAEGEEAPSVQIFNFATREHETRPARTETRVKVQPNGRGSRDFYRTDYAYVKNAEGDYERVETSIKPVTLNIIANITAVPK
ncbi:hypothetical protein [Kitasatospora mediocidica]|uniref:hypothetical protein n=1 Tax=Kitasatospora mediocidica TaxID=58352 RepID=UPI0012FAA59D|nr:hypothetical protein [Kitasatospora mediocidica]